MALPDGFHVRQATRAEVDVIVALARAEGWQSGLHDASIYSAADAGAFYVGVLPSSSGEGSGSEIVSTVSCAQFDLVHRVDEKAAFIGFYIVQPAFRGRGAGLAVFQHALRCARLAKCVTVGLDAVLEHVGTYRRSGFLPLAQVLCFSWTLAAATLESGPDVLSTGTRIVEVPSAASDPLWGALLTVDRDVSGLRRDAFLFALLTSPGAFGLVALRKSYCGGEDTAGGVVSALDTAPAVGGAAVGYVCARPCVEAGGGVGTFVIAPIFAPNAEIAERLLSAALRRLPPGATVRLNVPDFNAAAVEWIRGRGAGSASSEEYAPRETVRYLRMYTADLPPGAKPQLVFGLTSLELG